MFLFIYDIRGGSLELVVLGHALLLAFPLSPLPLPSLLLDNLPDPFLDRVVYLLAPLVLSHFCLSAQPQNIGTDLTLHLFLRNGVEAHAPQLVDRISQHFNVKSVGAFILDLFFFIFCLSDDVVHFNRIKSL